MKPKTKKIAPDLEDIESRVKNSALYNLDEPVNNNTMSRNFDWGSIPGIKGPGLLFRK